MIGPSESSADPGTTSFHPVWRLLVPSGGPWADGGEGLSVCALPDPAMKWKRALGAAIRLVPPGGALLVTRESGWPQVLLHRLTKGRGRTVRGPSARRLVRALRESGMRTERTYVLWPSAGSPQVVLPAGSLRAQRWLQRSGVLARQGPLPLVRTLSRFPLFTPAVWLLKPGVALVARRRELGDPGR